MHTYISSKIKEKKMTLNYFLFNFAYRSIPFRNQFSKYYASNEEYFPSVYPDYLMGTYLISGSAIHDLYKKALEQIFFKIEDIFVTGMVAPLVNAGNKIIQLYYYNCILYNYTIVTII